MVLSVSTRKIPVTNATGIRSWDRPTSSTVPIVVVIIIIIIIVVVVVVVVIIPFFEHAGATAKRPTADTARERPQADRHKNISHHIRQQTTLIIL